MARNPAPRFKADDAAALAAAEKLVARGHLARGVWRLVQDLEVAQLEAGYSALGQHGYAPRRLLALWVYASLIGLHHGTQLHERLKTDAALRLLSGGHLVSCPVLNGFRARSGALFQRALEASVRCAYQQGLVDVQALAVDSVRLRAEAAPGQVRVRARSERRLQQLAQQDVAALSAEAQALHEDKVRKHTHALEACEDAGRASVVLTSPLAGLMQFPDGRYAPGHRATAVAAGTGARIVVGVLVGAEGSDQGLLGPALLEAQRVLQAAGLPEDVPLAAAADAGYWCEADLRFCLQHAPALDVLVRDAGQRGALAASGLFTHADFHLQPHTRSVVCPAGRAMRPAGHVQPDGSQRYDGVGCAQCPLRPRCTRTQRSARSVYVRWDFEAAQQHMRARLAAPGAHPRYLQRMATVEPVFSSLQHAMGFRRVSSRHAPTVRAEVLLKLLAHNVRRLLSAGRLCCVLVTLEAPGAPPT